MKIKWIISTLFGAAVLSVSCEPNQPFEPTNPVEPAEPVYVELAVSNNALSTQVGTSATFEIASGNDGYTVFSLDPDVATATVSGKTVSVSTLAPGKTQVVVTDAGYKVARVDVVSYLVSSIALEGAQVESEIIVGDSGSFEIAVVSGNGGYEIASDTEGVSGTYNAETDKILISAFGQVDPYTAHLTVTDICGFSAPVDVVIKPSFNYWTDARKQTVLNSTSSFYYSVPSFLNTASSFNLTRKQTSSSYSYYAGKTDTGYSYGYKRMYTNSPPNNIRYVDVRIDIQGDLSVGRKEGHLYGNYYYLSNGDLWWNSILDTDTDERNIIEIISNNGSIVKGVVSYFYDGAVHNMYFIDSVVSD